MKFRIFNKNLNKFVDGGEWFASPDGRVFYFDVMEGEMVESKDCVLELIDENMLAGHGNMRDYYMSVHN